MRERAARQLTLGIVPLLIVGIALLVVLFVREHRAAAPVDRTTERAGGTVTAIEAHGDPRHATVAWTDGDGTRHRSRIAFPASNPPPQGAHVSVHYRPGSDRAFVGGDVTYQRIQSIVAGIFYVVVVLVVAAAVTGARVLTRRAAARRPATAVRVSRVRTTWRLIHRSALVVTEGRQEWWLPVYWEPVLSDLLAHTPASVHGRLGRGTVVVEVEGVTIWPSGRARVRPPRGDRRENPGTWSKAAAAGRGEPTAPLSMRRQARVDGVLALGGPFLALLWAYVNGSGPWGYLAGMFLLAAVLFWVPSIYGSDPT